MGRHGPGGHWDTDSDSEVRKQGADGKFSEKVMGSVEMAAKLATEEVYEFGGVDLEALDPAAAKEAASNWVKGNPTKFARRDKDAVQDKIAANLMQGPGKRLQGFHDETSRAWEDY